MMYAMIDAEGHYSDRAQVYDTCELLEDAYKFACRWNKRGKHKVQLIQGELDVGDEVLRSAVGTTYPRIAL